MAPTFKSGAFAQQCFTSHRLCLALKRPVMPRQVVLTCTSCNLSHVMTLRRLAVRGPAVRDSAGMAGKGETRGAGGREDRALDCLTRCAQSHPAALGVRAVDVLQDSVGLRCAECHRTYDLDVSAFETRQP